MTTYRIDQAPKGRGHKTWTCPHPSFRYSNMEAADAHATHLRFKDRKSQFVIRKEEGWVGDVRNFFRADDRPLVPGPYFRQTTISEVSLTMSPDGVISVSVPRHRVDGSLFETIGRVIELRYRSLYGAGISLFFGYCMLAILVWSISSDASLMFSYVALLGSFASFAIAALAFVVFRRAGALSRSRS